MRYPQFFMACAGIFLLACLTGCPAIPFVANDERSLGTQYADTEIESKIKYALLQNDPARAENTNVYSFRGHVFLVGEGGSAWSAFAESAARQQAGVRKVTTRWFPPGTSDRFKDGQIESAIDTNLLFASNVGSTRVNVDVWGGHVVLLGIMENQGEIERAIRETRGNPGVKSVESYLMTNDESLRDAGKR